MGVRRDLNTIVSIKSMDSVVKTAHPTILLIAQASLLSVAVANAVVATRTPVASESSISNLLSLLICLIAYVHYREISKARSWSKVDKLRHSDWLLTTPLLVLEFALFLKLNPFKNRHSAVKAGVSAALAVLMVIFGYLARIKRNTDSNLYMIMYLCGCACFVAICILLLAKNDKHKHKHKQEKVHVVQSQKRRHALVTAFLCLWGVYGLVFWLNQQQRSMVYTLLDALSKSGFGLVIALLGLL